MDSWVDGTFNAIASIIIKLETKQYNKNYTQPDYCNPLSIQVRATEFSEIGEQK